MRFAAYSLVLLLLGLPSISVADPIVWLNKTSTSKRDQVEIKFDSEAPHQTGRRCCA